MHVQSVHLKRILGVFESEKTLLARPDPHDPGSFKSPHGLYAELRGGPAHLYAFLIPTTTAQQKASLILLGIFSTLVLLEIVLRIGGFLFTLRQDWRNHAALSSAHEEFRILCISESTTALGGENSYPSQLENILNRQGLKQRFKVINKGLVSRTSMDILAELNRNLDRTQPDLVISMIGVNDPHSLVTENSWDARLEQCLQKFRAYHFFKLLGMHISQRTQAAKDDRTISAAAGKLSSPQNSVDFEFSREIDLKRVDPQKIIQQMIQLQALSTQMENYLQQNHGAPDEQELKNKSETVKLRLLWFKVYLGVYYRMHGDFRQAQDYLLMAMTQAPRNYSTYLELGRLYREQRNFSRAIVFLQRARILI